jgi:hypothetical protein
MEPSQSEISSEQYQELMTSLNWHAAILAVLLEEAGGAVEVSAEDLEKINVVTARVRITRQDETNTYLIERQVAEATTEEE